MGINVSAFADLFDEIDDITLPKKVISIDELSDALSDAPAIIHIKPSYQSKVLRLEDVSSKMTSSPRERISKEAGFGSIPSFIPRKLSPKKSSVCFESSASTRPTIADEQAGDYTRGSEVISPPDRRKIRSRHRQTGHTAPRPIVTVSSVTSNTKTNKMTGPTIPEPTDSPDYDSTSSSGCIIHRSSRHDMDNWTDEWKGVKEVWGLYDQKSDTSSACEINEFFEHKSAEKNNMKQRRRQLNSRTSVRSRASALSALSALSPRARSKSLISDASSISDHSDASSIVRIQTFCDLMPTAGWASPHCKDYEEEPYDPYK